MQKLNILFLHSASDLYGSGRILADTVEILNRLGSSCTVCLPEDGPLRTELENRGAAVMIVELGILRRRYLSPIGILNRVFALGASFFVLIRIVKEKKINLIYSNTTAVLIGSVVAAIMKIRHIWHVHEIIVRPQKFVKLLSYLLKNYADLVIAVSTPVKDHWLKYFGEHGLNICVVHNGIDWTRFTSSTLECLRDELGISKDSLVIGMIGRVHPWKGQDYFLKMAGKILKHKSNIRFIMVGDAAPGNEFLYEQLNAQKRKLGLEPFITDLGFRKDIAFILHSFDIFILPSILPDPLPTVILEAMSCAKPVVATSHGGSKEMVADGETGILIPWDNEDIAVQMMIPLIDSADLRHSFGIKGLERVKINFSMKAFENNLVSQINSVV